MKQMTKEEYDSLMKKFKEEYEQRQYDLQREYADRNNKYKVGDEVEDHQYRIRIERIRCEYMPVGDYPFCVYIGPIVNKDGSDGRTGYIYQPYVIEKKSDD